MPRIERRLQRLEAQLRVARALDPRELLRAACDYYENATLPPQLATVEERARFWACVEILAISDPQNQFESPPWEGR